MKQKYQQQALKLLKKRKLIDLKHQQLDNLHQMTLNMQAIDTNKMAIIVYAKSLETMKNVNKEIDLDKIDDLMLDIQDNMKLNNEIETTLSKSIVQNDVDEEELEDELNELIKQKQTTPAATDIETDSY